MGSLRKFRVLALFLVFCLLFQQPVLLQAKSYKSSYADISGLFRKPKSGDLAIGAAFTLLSCYVPAKLGGAGFSESFTNFGKGVFASSVSQAAMNIAVDKWNFNPEAAQVFGRAVTGLASGVFSAKDSSYNFGTKNSFWNSHNAFRGAVMGTFKGAAIGGASLLAYDALKGSSLYERNPYIGNQLVSLAGSAVGGGVFHLAANSAGFVNLGAFWEPMKQDLWTKAIGLGVQYAAAEMGIKPVYSRVLGDVIGGSYTNGKFGTDFSLARTLASSGISAGMNALAGDYDSRGYNKLGLTSAAMAGVEWLATSLAHGVVTRDFAFNRSFANLGTWGGTFGASGYNEAAFIQKIAEFGGYANFKANADYAMKAGGYTSWKEFVGADRHSGLFSPLDSSIVRYASSVMHQSAAENLADIAGIGFDKLRGKFRKEPLQPQVISEIRPGTVLPVQPGVLKPAVPTIIEEMVLRDTVGRPSESSIEQKKLLVSQEMPPPPPAPIFSSEGSTAVEDPEAGNRLRQASALSPFLLQKGKTYDFPVTGESDSVTMKVIEIKLPQDKPGEVTLGYTSGDGVFRKITKNIGVGDYKNSVVLSGVEAEKIKVLKPANPKEAQERFINENYPGVFKRYVWRTLQALTLNILPTAMNERNRVAMSLKSDKGPWIAKYIGGIDRDYFTEGTVTGTILHDITGKYRTRMIEYEGRKFQNKDSLVEYFNLSQPAPLPVTPPPAPVTPPVQVTPPPAPGPLVPQQEKLKVESAKEQKIPKFWGPNALIDQVQKELKIEDPAKMWSPNPTAGSGKKPGIPPTPPGDEPKKPVNQPSIVDTLLMERLEMVDVKPSTAKDMAGPLNAKLVLSGAVGNELSSLEKYLPELSVEKINGLYRGVREGKINKIVPTAEGYIIAVDPSEYSGYIGDRQLLVLGQTGKLIDVLHVDIMRQSIDWRSNSVRVADKEDGWASKTKAYVLKPQEILFTPVKIINGGGNNTASSVAPYNEVFKTKNANSSSPDPVSELKTVLLSPAIAATGAMAGGHSNPVFNLVDGKLIPPQPDNNITINLPAAAITNLNQPIATVNTNSSQPTMPVYNVVEGKLIKKVDDTHQTNIPYFSLPPQESGVASAATTKE